MAKISVQDSVSSPRNIVFATFRDDLDDLDEFLPDIESITTESREELDGGRTRIVRVWKAQADEIPTVARKFIKPEMLQWTDTATWDPDNHSCEWEMEVGFLTEAITARGVNRYSEKDGTTGIVIDGLLEVDDAGRAVLLGEAIHAARGDGLGQKADLHLDRKSTRLN